MRTVQAEFLSYKNAVIPKDASSIQVEECRRAFYAGAVSMMKIMTSIGEPGVSERAGIEIINGINSELAEFIKDIGKGTRSCERK